MSDVHHPPHYGGDLPTEPIKVIRAWGMNFALGNAVKYLSRAGKKGGSEKKVEDLSKAIFYVDDEIARGWLAERQQVVAISGREVQILDRFLTVGSAASDHLVADVHGVIERLKEDLSL